MIRNRIVTTGNFLDKFVHSIFSTYLSDPEFRNHLSWDMNQLVIGTGEDLEVDVLVTVRFHEQVAETINMDQLKSRGQIVEILQVFLP